MRGHVVLLSIPGLRERDLTAMPRLRDVTAGGASVPLSASFPAVTCATQATMTTGVLPQEHGVVANGFFWRERGECEMWTAGANAVLAPRLWDILPQHDPEITCAAWFPMLIKGACAQWVCTPAPIHNPDGSESLWCYTKPTELYGELRDALGHFPLMNFWGPLASIASTDWIVDSAVLALGPAKPRFSFVYLPHLDYAAQKYGPDSAESARAVGELDRAIGRLIDGFAAAGMEQILWLAASEYVIEPVDAVCYPNRTLRDAGLLTLNPSATGEELLDLASSAAWALADHQLAHVFVRDPARIEQVADLFRHDPLVAEVLVGDQRQRHGVDHPRSGEIVLLAQPNVWFAYYWWWDDAHAPAFARTVDIHRKPGYDPVELFLVPGTRHTPLDATLVRGSHGLPSEPARRQGVLLCSDASALPNGAGRGLRDVHVAEIVLRAFGVSRK